MRSMVRTASCVLTMLSNPPGSPARRSDIVDGAGQEYAGSVQALAERMERLPKTRSAADHQAPGNMARCGGREPRQHAPAPSVDVHRPRQPSSARSERDLADEVVVVRPGYRIRRHVVGITLAIGE